jgi:hypothetical protein
MKFGLSSDIDINKTQFFCCVERPMYVYAADLTLLACVRV